MPQSASSRPSVPLTSVFRPFACDDEFGRRVINPIELYYDQVAFSGIMLNVGNCAFAQDCAQQSRNAGSMEMS